MKCQGLLADMGIGVFIKNSQDKETTICFQLAAR